MHTLKSVIDENDSPAGKIFDISIQILIILSLVSFSIETLPDLKDTTLTKTMRDDE